MCRGAISSLHSIAINYEIELGEFDHRASCLSTVKESKEKLSRSRYLLMSCHRVEVVPDSATHAARVII